MNAAAYYEDPCLDGEAALQALQLQGMPLPHMLMVHGQREPEPADEEPGDEAYGTKAIAVSSNKPLTSRFRGVCWNKKNKRWQAAINSSGKYLYLGSYDTQEEAARVFDKAAVRIRFDKARLNYRFKDYVDANGNVIPDAHVESLLLEACNPTKPRRQRASKAKAIENGDGGAGDARGSQVPGVGSAPPTTDPNAADIALQALARLYGPQLDAHTSRDGGGGSMGGMGGMGGTALLMGSGMGSMLGLGGTGGMGMISGLGLNFPMGGGDNTAVGVLQPQFGGQGQSTLHLGGAHGGALGLQQQLEDLQQHQQHQQLRKVSGPGGPGGGGGAGVQLQQLLEGGLGAADAAGLSRTALMLAGNGAAPGAGTSSGGGASWHLLSPSQQLLSGLASAGQPPSGLRPLQPGFNPLQGLPDSLSQSALLQELLTASSALTTGQAVAAAVAAAAAAGPQGRSGVSGMLASLQPQAMGSASAGPSSGSGAEDLPAIVRSHLPPGAELGSLIQSDTQQLVGVLYAQLGCGGRTGAGVWNGHSFQSLGMYGSEMDARQACVGALRIYQDVGQQSQGSGAEVQLVQGQGGTVAPRLTAGGSGAGAGSAGGGVDGSSHQTVKNEMTMGAAAGWQPDPTCDDPSPMGHQEPDPMDGGSGVLPAAGPMGALVGISAAALAAAAAGAAAAVEASDESGTAGRLGAGGNKRPRGAEGFQGEERSGAGGAGTSAGAAAAAGLGPEGGAAAGAGAGASGQTAAKRPRGPGAGTSDLSTLSQLANIDVREALLMFTSNRAQQQGQHKPQQ